MVCTLEGHTDAVDAVAVTANGRCAVSASRDHTLRLWDLSSGKTLHTLQGHSSSVTAVVVTPNGCRAVSASHDGTLRLWDLERGKEIAAFTRRDWHGWSRYRFRRADDCWWRSIRSIAFPSIRPSRRNKACNRRYKDPAFKPRGANNGFVSCSGPSVSLNVGSQSINPARKQLPGSSLPVSGVSPQGVERPWGARKNSATRSPN